MARLALDVPKSCYKTRGVWSGRINTVAFSHSYRSTAPWTPLTPSTRSSQRLPPPPHATSKASTISQTQSISNVDKRSPYSALLHDVPYRCCPGVCASPSGLVLTDPARRRRKLLTPLTLCPYAPGLMIMIPMY
ncbi:hypothetical protein EXIGLDRAFT_301238 [Exidia glandulosa HHB12029]|uniref:Uncharacterized protein n=1 Tax=Exidia glandulosa HHB12029 TaxID=1314781 RepID=A0A165D7M3_EXIGL|nr:hypothetical protein EXIGLDRAFT_301238 [Exidia glandulosa HHB12029]